MFLYTNVACKSSHPKEVLGSSLLTDSSLPEVLQVPDRQLHRKSNAQKHAPLAFHVAFSAFKLPVIAS